MIQATNAAGSKSGRINSYADFHIYFIGKESNKILRGVKYLTVKANDKNQTKKILDAINEQTADSRNQKFTHLHTALDDILNEKNPPHVAGGVFIFTDAQITDGDFKEVKGDTVLADLPTYVKAINLRIAKIQTQRRMPVFLVQSYRMPQNDFTLIPDSTKRPNVDKELIRTANWFWMRNSLVAGSEQVQKEFQQFIDQANVMIVDYNRLPPKYDKVLAAISIEQVLELVRNINSVNIAQYINQAKPGNMSAGELKALQDIIKLSGDSSYTDVKIRLLQDAVESLRKAPQVLQDLGVNLSKNLGSKLSLISDQSLNAAKYPAVKAEVAAVKDAKSEDLKAMIINGIAKYLVERVKQEIAFYFIGQVNEHTINKPNKYREIGEYLLANTKQIISKPENYKDINTLRTALLQDVADLPYNITRHPELFSRSEGLVTLTYFYQLYNHIRQTNSLELSFEKLADQIEKKMKAKAPSMVNFGPDGLDRKISKMEQSILFTSRLVGYLRNHDLSKVFIEQQPDTLAKMLSLLSLDGDYVKKIQDVQQLGPILNNIYLKYQDLKTTAERSEQIFKAPIEGNVEEFQRNQFRAVNDLLIRVSDLLLSGSDILNLIQVDPADVISRYIAPIQGKIKVAEALTLKLDKDYAFKFAVNGKDISLTVTDIKQAANTYTISKLTDEIKKITIGITDYNIHLFNYDKKGLSGEKIAFEIEQVKNQLTTDFTSQSVVRSASNTMQAYFLLRDHHYLDAVNLLIPELQTALRDRVGNDTEVLEHLEKLLRIAGGVVNAQNSDDIESVIAKNAMGPGGYREKRESKKTFYLNAYAGGALTYYSGDNKVSGALFAPVGFELAWGRNGSSKSYKSWGIMVSVIEVGNIINYQLANNGADQKDVTALSRVFAPGIYGSWGMSTRHPLSIIAGYQVNPGRVNVGIAFDLPIFPFLQRK